MGLDARFALGLASLRSWLARLLGFEGSMIHLLALTDDPEPYADDVVQQLLEMYFEGHWIQARQGVWLLATRMTATDCRDLLGPELTNNGLTFVVLQQQGNWGGRGITRVATWLRRWGTWAR